MRFIPSLAIVISIFSLICVIILLKKLKYMDEPLIVFKKFIIIPGGEELKGKEHLYKFGIVLAIILSSLVCMSGLWVANKALDTSNNIIVTQTQINNDNAPVEAKIDINSCTLEEFKSLKGVGDTKAEKFICVREELGRFKSVYDLIEYDIIGENTLNKNIDKIEVME